MNFNTIKKLSTIIFVLFLIDGCASKKDIIYNFDDNKTNLKNFKDISIQKGDILNIKVSALNPESTIIFQNEMPSINMTNNIDLMKITGYLVSESGNIEFPVLGTVSVLGKSTTKLEEYLQERLKKFLLDPVIQVRLLNYKVTVLGEVSRPGTYDFQEERVTLPQVLGIAGDLTINADRKNIVLVRNEGDKMFNTVIDLTSGDLTNTPYFYMNQNDIIYVNPNLAKVKSSGLVGNVGSLTSVLSLLLSLTILFTR